MRDPLWLANVANCSHTGNAIDFERMPLDLDEGADVWISHSPQHTQMYCISLSCYMQTNTPLLYAGRRTHTHQKRRHAIKEMRAHKGKAQRDLLWHPACQCWTAATNWDVYSSERRGKGAGGNVSAHSINRRNSTTMNLYIYSIEPVEVQQTASVA
jgi:hypothetical protein